MANPAENNVKNESPAQENKMGVMPVGRLLFTMSLPIMISMLVQALYNVVDSMFVARVSENALTALSMAFPIQNLMIAVSTGLGVGLNAVLSRALGAKDEKLASQFVATGFFSAFGAGVIISILGNLCLDPLVRFLGATETIAPYARDYAAYIFYGAPFMMCSLAMNNLLRFEGLAAYGMVGITSGGLLNIVLDPILIFGLKLGTALSLIHI